MFPWSKIKRMLFKFVFFLMCIFLLNKEVITEINCGNVHEEIQVFKDMLSTYSKEIADLKNTVKAQSIVMKKQDMELKLMKTEIQEIKRHTTFDNSSSEKSFHNDKRLLLNGQTQSDRQHIAFYAHLSKSIDHLGNYQTIIFDKVRTNQGGAYNAADGEFRAISPGTYFFIWTTSNGDLTTMESQIVVNGVVYGQTFSDAANHNDWAVSTAFTIVHLQIDDRVWIVHTGNISELGNGSSSFAGFRLW